MDDAPTDRTVPAAFLAGERASWDATAPAWHEWWGTFEAGARPLNDRLCALAYLAKGHRVLDVATGIGEPALTAAGVVGAAGRVLATDLSPAMVARARARAAALGVRNVWFAAAAAEELPLAAASFDGALCRFGLMLAADPAAAAARVREALRPRARFALAVWGAPESVPFLSLPRRVAERELALPPRAPDEPGPLRLGRPDLVRAALRGGGFTRIDVEATSVTLRFSDPSEYARCMRSLSSTLREALAARPEAARRAFEGALAAAAAPHRGPLGELVFVNEVLCASAR